VLLEVERDAASFDEPHERAILLASCADALWDADEREARVIFRRAWDAAAESDEADLKDEQEDGRSADLPERFTSAREAVLASVAKRDTRTAEAWLRSLNEWPGRHESSARDNPYVADGGASRDAGPLNEFTRDGRRLALASSLLEGGDYGASASVAAPALRGGVSGPLVEFLIGLRARAPEEANRLYTGLLAATRADSSADANDVLLLSSYVLTPGMLAVVNDDGSLQLRALGGAQPAAPGDAARAAFYDAAASILLRPSQPSGAQDATSSALYFAAGRLLPFFERDAPRYAPALRARMSALASGHEVARRAPLDAVMETRSLSPRNPADPLGPLVEEIARSDAAGSGDLARDKAVAAAVKRRLWERAKRIAEEMKDEEGRDAARALIGARQVASVSDAYAEGDTDDFEKAAAFVRQANLSPAVAPAMRAYGLAEAAELAARGGNGERAAALLDEAVAYAQQAASGTELRAAASMTVATHAARLAPSRLWETLVAAVASLNADKEFSGNVVYFAPDGVVKYYPEELRTIQEVFAPFTLERMFEGAGGADLSRAVAEARNLEDEFARARALVAAARASLRKGAGRGYKAR
jgi:hypothetical protein